MKEGGTTTLTNTGEEEHQRRQFLTSNDISLSLCNH